MCGIVGVISKAGTLSFYVPSLFTNMLRIDSIRGEDSTGCFGVTSNGHVDMMKGDTDGYHFTTTASYWDFAKRIDKNYKIVVGHNRKATTGAVNATNAHPFQHKHIMMVHNGNIKNAKGIADVEVDSEAIAHALAGHDPVTALGKLDGAYAIAWFDKSDNTLSLARNKERPLYLVEYEYMWVFSSELWLPLGLNGRDGRKLVKSMEVPTERILTFNLDSLAKGFYEIPYEEFKQWSKPKPEPVKSYDIWPRSDTSSITTPLSMKKSNPYRAGDRVIFQLADEKVENGAQVILGHPVFDGKEKDENIFIRVVLKKGDDALKYFGLDPDKSKNFHNEFWQGTVLQVRELGGMWTVYVHEFKPHVYVRDHNGAENTEEDVKSALSQGCNKCKKTITLEEVKKGIARKRADGSWRLICPSCLHVAIQEANQANPHLNLSVQ